MSFKAMDLVMKASVPGPAGMKLVLLSLAHRCRADVGYSCWPSQARLALDTNQSERSVRAHLRALEAQGYITRTSRGRASGRTSDRITVVLSRLTVDEPVDDAPADAPEVEPDGVQPADSSATNRQILPVQPADIAGKQVSESLTRSPDVGGAGAAGLSSHQQRQQVSHGATDHVTPPFPRWAIAKLGRAGESQAQAWQQAWATITSMVDPHWDPNLHLTKYLAQCEEKRRTPTPSDWTKWYAEDEQRAAKDKAAAAAVDRSSTNPYWE